MEPFPRDLTRAESDLIRWLLENGNPDAKAYMYQIEGLRVHSGCPCGCASVVFVADSGSDPGMTILSDYLWKEEDGNIAGIFAYAHGAVLGGMEVVSYHGSRAPTYLPKTINLIPWKQAGK